MPAASRVAALVIVVAAAILPSRPALSSTTPGDGGNPVPQVGGAASPGSLEAWVGRGAQGSVVPPPGRSCEPWTVLLSYAGTTARVLDGVTWRLMTRVCGDVVQSAWIPALSPADLARLALDDVVRLLPVPSPVMAPVFGREGDGRDVYGPIVHAPFWFAVDAAQWLPVRARAQLPALGLWSEVTATPSRVVFTPAEPDGATEVGCEGPGRVYRPGVDHLVDGPCRYSFVHSSSVSPSGRGWPSLLSIEWQVSWVASTGEVGSFGVRRSTNGCLDRVNGCVVPALEVLGVVTHVPGE